MEPTHYKTASDISCNNMLCLAKKHQDYNRNIFLNRMISTNCGRGDSEGYFVIGEWINPKHCHNKRPDYNLDWWDKKNSFCVGEEFNQNTNAKFNNKQNKNFCPAPDFSKANLVDFTIENNPFNNHDYKTPKTCDMI